MPIIPQAIRANEAGILIEKKESATTLSALRAVIINGDDKFEYADPSTFEGSQVAGILLGAAPIGTSVKAQLYGRLEDSYFNFPLHDDLYLGSNGIVTNIAPELPTPHSVLLGYSLGPGAIFIRIERPIIL